MTSLVAMAMETIATTLPKVDSDDDFLREIIRGVEALLSRACPSPVNLAYHVDGSPRHILLRQSARQPRWHIAWHDSSDAVVPLLSAPRAVRVEAFTPAHWSDDAYTGLSPIEVLVVLCANELQGAVAVRGQPLEVARRLQVALAGMSRLLRKEG